MASGLSDERLRELIADAYQDTDLGVPLRSIERAARREPRRRFTLAVAAVAAIATVSTVFWVLLPDGDAGLMPGVPIATPGSATPNGKPPRPTSSATTAEGRCADYARAELAGADNLSEEEFRAAPPPLRFQVTLIGSQLDLLLYASERTEVACWLMPEHGTVAVNSSGLTTNRPAHPTGQLSNSSSAHGRDPVAAYTFGRVPPGTTKVEVYFPDGSRIDAQLLDGWYLAWATGEASHRFSDITRIVAYTSTRTHTTPVEHG